MSKDNPIKMTYTEQMVSSLEQRLDARIVSFFELKKQFFRTKTIRKLIKECMDEYFDGKKDREELMPIIESVKKSRRQKKSRWHLRFNKDMETYPAYTSPKNPLHNLYVGFDKMKIEEYEAVYGNLSKQEVIDREIAKETAWHKSRNYLLIDYPFLMEYYSWSTVYTALKMDIVVCMWNYIFSELNGNLSAFYLKYPKEFINKPLFAPDTYKLNAIKDEEEKIKFEIYEEPEIKEVLEISPIKDSLNPYKAMNNTDIKIMNTFFNAITDAFYRTRKTVIPFTKFCNDVLGYNWNEEVARIIEERCSNMVKYSYKGEIGGDIVIFNLFDSIRIVSNVNEENGEKPYVEAMFGSVLYDSIVKNKLISITKENYDMLDNAICKIMIYALQQDRIISWQENSLTSTLDYSFFSQNVMFRQRNRKKNMTLIIEALDEFVEKKIIIDRYTFDGSHFYITFIPLSEEEIADITFKNNLPTIDTVENITVE